MIAIVTETLSCMNLSDCAALGVSLAPLDCVIDGLRSRDRIILSEQTVPPGDGFSVPPTEQDYRTRFAALLADHDGVVCITASGKFSDSNSNALHAAAEFAGRVVVVDSGSVAGGLFLLTLQARYLISLGYPMSRIKAELEIHKNALRVSFTTDSTRALEAAKKLSYKMPVGQAILSRHPIFRIERGGIGVYGYASGAHRVADELLSVFAAPRDDGEIRPAPTQIVVHYGVYDDAGTSDAPAHSPAVEHLLRRIRELYPDATVYERPITLSLRVNLGRDIIGLIGN